MCTAMFQADSASRVFGMLSFRPSKNRAKGAAQRLQRRTLARIGAPVVLFSCSMGVGFGGEAV